MLALLAATGSKIGVARHDSVLVDELLDLAVLVLLLILANPKLQLSNALPCSLLLLRLSKSASPPPRRSPSPGHLLRTFAPGYIAASAAVATTRRAWRSHFRTIPIRAPGRAASNVGGHHNLTRAVNTQLAEPSDILPNPPHPRALGNPARVLAKETTRPLESVSLEPSCEVPA